MRRESRLASQPAIAAPTAARHARSLAAGLRPRGLLHAEVQAAGSQALTCAGLSCGCLPCFGRQSCGEDPRSPVPPDQHNPNSPRNGGDATSSSSQVKHPRRLAQLRGIERDGVCFMLIVSWPDHPYSRWLACLLDDDSSPRARRLPPARRPHVSPSRSSLARPPALS